MDADLARAFLDRHSSSVHPTTPSNLSTLSHGTVLTSGLSDTDSDAGLDEGMGRVEFSQSSTTDGSVKVASSLSSASSCRPESVPLPPPDENEGLLISFWDDEEWMAAPPAARTRSKTPAKARVMSSSGSTGGGAGSKKGSGEEAEKREENHLLIDLAMATPAKRADKVEFTAIDAGEVGDFSFL